MRRNLSRRTNTNLVEPQPFGLVDTMSMISSSRSTASNKVVFLFPTFGFPPFFVDLLPAQGPRGTDDTRNDQGMQHLDQRWWAETRYGDISKVISGA
jgi:hypothetical protein